MTAKLDALKAVGFPDGAPRLGFGTGDVFAGDSAAESQRLIDAAYDGGFRYFDTARLYGDGSAESVLGEALAGKRDKVIIASKAGIMPWRMRTMTRVVRKGLTLARLPAPPAKAQRGAFRPAQIRQSLETSLKALKTDYVDLFLLHESTVEEASRPEVGELLERLKDEGKIRLSGVAGEDVDTPDLIAAALPFTDVVQAYSDAIARQARGYALGEDRLLSTHSALKNTLPLITTRAAQDDVFAKRFESATGVPTGETSRLASLLLSHALWMNPEGFALASTLKPERAGGLLGALREAAFEDAQFQGLEAALDSLNV